MKPGSKGIIIILVFIVLLPFTADIIISLAMPANNGLNFIMSKNLLFSYLKLAPWYIVYLIIAFVILYLIKEFKKNKSKQQL